MRRHGLDSARVVHAKQRPEAIDAGVFHNDVIAVGQGRVLLHHEEAFEDESGVLARLRRLLGDDFVSVRIASSEVSLAEAVRSYLFNSQLVTTPSGDRVLIAPRESQEEPAVKACLDRLVSDPAVPIHGVRFFDLRESMRNGGGPACLRLRVPLHDAEWNAVTEGCRFQESRCQALEDWVRRRYRETLAPNDLADPHLLVESRDALDELTRLLGLGAIYPFQR